MASPRRLLPIVVSVASVATMAACSSGDDAAATTVADSVSLPSEAPSTTADATTVVATTIETTTPDTTAPDTTAPGTTAPGTTAPDVTPTTNPPIVDGRLFLPLVPRLGDAVEQTTVQELEQIITNPDGTEDTGHTRTEIVTERVVVATDASSYTVSETVTSATIEFPDDPAQAEAAQPALDSMVGAEVVITYALDGTELDRQIIAGDDLDPVARQALEAVTAVVVATPEGGAAPGDTWEIATDGTGLGVPAIIATTFTLTSFDDASYATSSSAEIDGADLFGSMFDEVDGSMLIESTSEGSLSNALDVDGTSTVIVDADLTTGGETGHLHQEQRILITSTPL